MRSPQQTPHIETPLQIANFNFQVHAMGCTTCGAPGHGGCEHGTQLLKKFHTAMVRELVAERGVKL